MRVVSLVLLLVIAGNVFAQNVKPGKGQEPVNIYAAVDAKMLAIPEAQTSTTKDVANYINANFTTEKDKVRAVYAWTTNTFEYDYDNMFALNFYEKKENKAEKMMRLRKGICENYAAVFSEICNKCGIKAYVVPGYTRHDDFTSYLPHAWCSAVVDNEYFLFDPTWGAGYISNKKFVRKLSNDYFMQNPASHVRTHMPFDMMWQMLNYPLTAKEFEERKPVNDKNKNYFSFPDSIAAYEKMSQLEQYEAEARRIEQNGIKNALVYNQLANLKQNIEIERQNGLVNTYNSAVADFNLSVSELNEFINYRNKQFTPLKTDMEIQGMVDTVDHKLSRVAVKLATVKGRDNQVDAMVSPMEKQMAEVTKTVQEQQEFLKKYFKKGKLMRKSMFYKYTWMGIPIN